MTGFLSNLAMRGAGLPLSPVLPAAPPPSIASAPAVPEQSAMPVEVDSVLPAVRVQPADTIVDTIEHDAVPEPAAPVAIPSRPTVTTAPDAERAPAKAPEIGRVPVAARTDVRVETAASAHTLPRAGGAAETLPPVNHPARVLPIQVREPVRPLPEAPPVVAPAKMDQRPVTAEDKPSARAVPAPVPEVVRPAEAPNSRPLMIPSDTQPRTDEHEPPPAVHVRIGRIEIRGTTPAPAPARAAAPAPSGFAAYAAIRNYRKRLP